MSKWMKNSLTVVLNCFWIIDFFEISWKPGTFSHQNVHVQTYKIVHTVWEGSPTSSRKNFRFYTRVKKCEPFRKKKKSELEKGTRNWLTLTKNLRLWLVIFFNPQNSHLKQTLLSPFHRWGKWNLNSFSTTKYQITYSIRVSFTPKLMFFLLHHSASKYYRFSGVLIQSSPIYCVFMNEAL